MGIDGISLFFVLLSTLLTPICILASWEVGRGPRQGVHGRLPGPRDLHGRHVLRARPRAVLRLLRGRADPDVPDHRRLGRPAARLCRLQVLPLHAARLGPDAAGDPRHLLAARHHRPPDRGDGAPAAAVHLAVLAVARLLRLVRGQGADVAGPHLAARRPRRGADGGLGDPGRRAAEDGRLRLPPLLDAAAARGDAVLRAADLRPLASSP